MSVIMRGAILLYLLCFWTQRRVDAITPEVLANITREIIRVTNMNNQYSFAVVLPQDECNRQWTHGFTDNAAQLIRRALNGNNRMYLGERVIAARPLFNSDFTDHAEYRLLVTNEEGHSHMSDLINKWSNEPSCTVFFTLNSPCGEKCSNPGNDYNILQFLEVFKNRDHNMVAFVFSDIFHFNINMSRQDMLNLLKRIHVNGGNIPVYRCPAGSNTCFNCMATFNTQNNRCLEGMPN
nr:uncharacterized protein LOC129442533 [Misgurnus anguillicaudatus]